ncbi:carboxypeptidase regulatory-like domain-containing protein, partial [Ulvibacter sp.]|nr:carboxypeptidase regulatory-like domain-containing protein [Ulvibacter sp.]
IVRDDSNNPLEDATVTIDGSSISAQSDSNGEYQLIALPYGTYDISASKFGYNDQTITTTLDAPNTLQDFVLSEKAVVQINGRVVGSNDTNVPLENVEISLDGYTSDNTTTDNLGEFNFPTVYGDNEYELTFSLYGYNEKTVMVTVVDATIELGDVVLDQEYISPFDVSVSASTDATIVWKNPLESTKEKLQNDLDVNSFSYTNEPNENVWLGNIFTINEITTLTNVEIRTDIYNLAADFVSIDVFDVASEEIIASSEPFLLERNALINIDIPNIVVYDDIMVAVHWQNNPESTYALVTDFSDPSVPNTAVIKYPGGPITLLSEAIGAFESSFHVRINTLDDGTPNTNNEVLSYNVRRGLASEFPNTSNWELLTPSPVSDLSFVDTDWGSTIASEQYRFAVETIYSQDVSEVTFSNVIDGTLLGIAGNDLENSVVVYPVPASNLINIAVTSSFDSNSSIQIFDVLGKYVTEINMENLSDGVLTKDVSYFENGIYFLRISNGKALIHKKFIISN